MNTKLISELTSEYKKAKHPDFRVGDMLEVHEKIKEGGKERTQVFRGVVIAIKGSGVSRTFTIRKISYGIGVEKIYPLYSPNISKIKVAKRAEKIRKSKLYYLRERIGKQALKVGTQIPVEGEDLETEFEEEINGKTESPSAGSVHGSEQETEKKEEKDKQQNPSTSSGQAEKQKTETDKQGTEKKEKEEDGE